MKRSGLGQRFAIDGVDVSGDVGEVGRAGGGPALLDVTGLNVTAHERIGGLRDGGIEFKSWWNPERVHPVLRNMPSQDRAVLYASAPDAGMPACGLIGKQMDYAGERENDGAFSFEVQVLATANGLAWGDLLTAWPHTSTGAETVASVDLLAAAPDAYDAEAHLHVFSFDGTDATVSVETSSDDGGSDAFATRMTFQQITELNAPFGQRVTQTTPADLMERYARVRVATSGGFTNLQFAVMLMVRQAAE